MDGTLLNLFVIYLTSSAILAGESHVCAIAKAVGKAGRIWSDYEMSTTAAMQTGRLSRNTMVEPEISDPMILNPTDFDLLLKIKREVEMKNEDVKIKEKRKVEKCPSKNYWYVRGTGCVLIFCPGGQSWRNTNTGNCLNSAIKYFPVGNSGGYWSSRPHPRD